MAGWHAPSTLREPRGAPSRTRKKVIRSAESHPPAVDLMRSVIRTDVAWLVTWPPVRVSQSPWKYSTTTVDEAGADRTSAHSASLVEGVNEQPVTTTARTADAKAARVAVWLDTT
jgi:hypothetical protein